MPRKWHRLPSLTVFFFAGSGKRQRKGRLGLGGQRNGQRPHGLRLLPALPSSTQQAGGLSFFSFFFFCGGQARPDSRLCNCSGTASHLRLDGRGRRASDARRPPVDRPGPWNDRLDPSAVPLSRTLQGPNLLVSALFFFLSFPAGFKSFVVVVVVVVVEDDGWGGL